MSNRIDHAAEAKLLVEAWTHDYTPALVHATLALVEQQRMANLIQLMHVPLGDLSEEIKSALHGAFHDDRDWEAELREAVIET